MAQCLESRIMNKSIDCIISIDKFEQHFFVITGVLQSPRLEDHIKTIGVDQSLSNRYYFEHKRLNNIKNIYQHAGNYYDQQHLKDILDADMVSTPE